MDRLRITTRFKRKFTILDPAEPLGDGCQGDSSSKQGLVLGQGHLGL